jgi:Cu(I)/Ag(I) efflux system membrane fusion protein
MHRSRTLAATALMLFWFVGCAGSSPAPAPTTPAANGTATGEEHADHDHGAASADVAANLAKLSAEDRAAAEKQRVCPVSDEPLGSMGVPIKVDVSGKSVWICCDGCREDLLADPDKYLAKLK